ncbi:hypothetical protein [Halomarina rubra]|uniref:Uncharacterized protein n=1 Tax=Halomarina rubra TaxID=2071873 RepID=A0ABD6AT13_9EURY|nr:hypothetical protein [Halomarina rubra]
MYRRTLLSSLGALGATTLAGCSSTSEEGLPAGSLRFINRHDLPHLVSLTVLDAGSSLASSGAYENGTRVTGDVSGRTQRVGATTTTTVGPGETTPFETIFSEPVWYDVEFSFDGSTENGRTAYHPAPPDRDHGNVLEGVITDSGRSSWQVSSTDNLGVFASRNDK